ncbi:hypothetical protein [Heliorestis convoluta]|uniref:Uncharacterized protein n=1 Tax=Heliorestis convoluta TaxID=356322 RepID=A0A5Q2MZ01_9FIRM|nr:hypothetical protein [Heliorestis convoluta]QGG48194.1 hypothetical protein FTV88_2096 [Heliorestis convoluta]
MFTVAIWFSAGMALFVGLLTAIVAFGASIGWTTILTRSMVAALVTGGLTFAIAFYFVKILEKNDLAEHTIPEDVEKSKGNNLDVQIPAEKPFVPGQIEAELEELLATDPARAAEIIRKMQLEE